MTARKRSWGTCLRAISISTCRITVAVGRGQRKNGALFGQRGGGSRGDRQMRVDHQGNRILESEVH